MIEGSGKIFLFNNINDCTGKSNTNRVHSLYTWWIHLFHKCIKLILYFLNLAVHRFS
jgi:hypothetical protein